MARRLKRTASWVRDRMEDLVARGLPRFLAQFLEQLRDLGDRIATDFLIPPVEA